jgi:hypothetical protein
MIIIKHPTQEQIQRFWGWCGIEHRYIQGEGLSHKLKGDWFYGTPILDLNNIFKYAVPRLMNRYQLYIDFGISLYDVTLIECTDNTIHKAINTCESDLALALFWAINELICLEELKYDSL